MKFLADVNVDRRIITRLRADGHDVQWIVDINRELDDIALLRLAWEQGAIILTNDKDLQRHVLKENHPTHGIVWLRLGLVKMSRAQQIERTIETIRTYQDHLIHLVTAIYPDHVEQEQIPTQHDREDEDIVQKDTN